MKHKLTLYEKKLNAYFSKIAINSIESFCINLSKLEKSKYSEALIGMGYQYESFDYLFSIIASNIQATVDVSDYSARYKTMQDVLQPYASEYSIESERKLGQTHRELYEEFYNIVTNLNYPSKYPNKSSNLWIKCGQYWSQEMINHLRCKDMNSMDRAKYNLGYHWAVEFLSVKEFDLLKEAWDKIGIQASFLEAHCEVEEEHAKCAISAINNFCSIDDPLIKQGIIDHEYDLAGFYNECSKLI